ncbi:MAG: hypothetical protein V7K49_20465 [Nostoc sp.]
MPNAQCPMPNAQCPMPNAQCPMPNIQYNSWRGCANYTGSIERLVLSAVEASRDAQCPMPNAP